MSLIRCFAAAHAAPDIDAAIARCEKEEFGTQWRQAAGSPPDAGEGPRPKLDPALIQASVRARFDYFRACYVNGLARDATLRGRVTVELEVDASGHVTQAKDAGSDLPDPDVVACIVKEFAVVRFPKPESGTIRIVYPLIFELEDKVHTR